MSKFILAAVWLVVLASVASAAPNIVVITSDDQTLADQVVMTKTNDLLGANGTTFSRFFAQHGLCCPSRATFLTGQYPHNHGVMWNTPPGGYTGLDHTRTLATWMRSAGYHTSFIGKYLNGLGEDYPTTWETRPSGWDNWQPLIKTYRMFGYTMNDNGVFFQAPNEAVRVGARRLGARPEDYQVDALTIKAETYIASRAGSLQPFFLVVAPASPHKEVNMPAPDDLSIRPPARHIGKFSTLLLPKPPSYNEADVSDKPRHIQKLPLITPTVEGQILKRFRNRREALLAVDDMVEKIVLAVTNIGQLDNTVFIYWSDNGYENGEHRISDNKNEIYDESLRVPLLIRGGGFPVGTTANQLTANIDIAPTILAQAGVLTVDRVLDGQDLKPLALDSGLGVSRSILINAYHGDNYARGIRTDAYKYVEHDRSTAELYDLNVDPYEMSSKHATTSYNNVKLFLQDQLRPLKTCTGIVCIRGY